MSNELLIGNKDQTRVRGAKMYLLRDISFGKEDVDVFLFEREPTRINQDSLDELINMAVNVGASDISIRSDRPPSIEINGRYRNAMRRALSSPEVDMCLTEIFGASNARTEINSMKQLNFSYETTLWNGERQRFRVNVTGCLGDDDQGLEISMRVLPRVTPSKESVLLTDDEITAMMPKDGLVVIAGGTGHGKSTTMAAVTAEHLKSKDNPVKIVDIQKPIEYTFRDVIASNEGSASFIVQSEVGRHLKNFDDGVVAALRRKPNIINVGEASDTETIAAAIEASLTGHLVYTTTHAGSIAETIQRLLSRFSGIDREAKANDLASSLRFIMVQVLLPRIDKPGRIPVREYLRVTERIRENLSKADIRQWPAILTDEVNGKTQGTTPDDLRKSMRESAVELYRQGIISKAAAMALSRTIRTET